MTAHLRIFVINLARSPERRRAMAGRLDELGLDHESFPAVDGAVLPEAALADYDRKARLKTFGCDLLPNGLGCYLSHYRIYEKIIAENIQRVLILEDDLDISGDLPAILDALAEAPTEWELVRLSGLSAPGTQDHGDRTRLQRSAPARHRHRRPGLPAQ